MGAIYGTYGSSSASADDEDEEPSPRNDAERIEWILQRLTKPADTPAVTPWGDQPETFDQIERPSRIDAQAMAPIYEQVGFLGRYLGNFVGIPTLPIAGEAGGAAAQYLMRRAINKAIFQGSRWIQDFTDQRSRSSRGASDGAFGAP